MPFKLIGTIILLVAVTIFCGFNLGEANKCDVNLIFYTFHNVPSFLTVLISFFCGCLVMVPFTFGRKKKMSRQEIADAAKKQQLEDKKNLEKEQKAKLKAEQKAASQAQKESRSEEKTIFDFKIRRSVDKKDKTEKSEKSVNSVPKIEEKKE